MTVSDELTPGKRHKNMKSTKKNKGVESVKDQLSHISKDRTKNSKHPTDVKKKRKSTNSTQIISTEQQSREVGVEKIAVQNNNEELLESKPSQKERGTNLQTVTAPEKTNNNSSHHKEKNGKRTAETDEDQNQLKKRVKIEGSRVETDPTIKSKRTEEKKKKRKKNRKGKDNSKVITRFRYCRIKFKETVFFF